MIKFIYYIYGMQTKYIPYIDKIYQKLTPNFGFIMI